MRNLEILRKVSDEKTEIAFDFYFNENNKMALCFLLLGMGGYDVKTVPDAAHNYHEVLNSIYKYHNEHSDKNVLEAFENVFCYSASTVVYIEHFLLLMKYIYAHLDNEKNNKAPFKIDLKKLLESIKLGLENYKKIGEKSILMQEAKKADKYLYENYGHKIL